MKRSWRAFAATLLLITPLLSSCGEVAHTVNGPPTVERQDGLIGGLVGVLADVVGGVLRLLVGGEDANGQKVSKSIGSAGGTLTTGAYTLIVPAGAVSQPTIFEIAPTNDGTYSIDLNATQKSGSGRRKSYDTFSKPLTFVISYAGADNLEDPLRLVMVYVAPSGPTEAQPTTINTESRTASCQMHHFSKYALVQN